MDYVADGRGKTVEGVSISLLIFSYGSRGFNGFTVSFLLEEDDWGITFTALNNGDGYEVTLIGANFVHMETTDGSDMTIEKTYGSDMTIEKTYGSGRTHNFNFLIGSYSKQTNHVGTRVPSSINIDSFGPSYGAPAGVSYYDTETWGVTWSDVIDFFN